MTFFRSYLRRRAAPAALRTGRPEAPDFLVATLAGRIDADARRRRGSRSRTALATALTGVLAAALFTVGGVSYAGNAMNGAFEVVRKAVAPTGGQQAVALRGISAGGDQYRPGYGFGDPNQNHTGPPGISRSGGEGAPPLRAAPARDGRAALVGTTVTFDEQASLFISVLDSAGKQLLLTQDSKRGGSRVGNRVGGPQTKFIRYTLLVPRSVPLQLRIPINLLRAGGSYTLRIVAFDHTGNRTEFDIPFTL